MITRLGLIFVLLAAVPMWSQTTGTGTGTGTQTGTGNGTGTPTSTDEEPDNSVMNSGMLTPPPVSGQAYPVATGDEVRVNYMSFGLTGEVAYDDNVLAGFSATPQGDVIYSIWPTVTLDKSTLALREQFSYSPGFTFYEPSSDFNETDQNASMNFQYHPGSNATLIVQDSFLRSSSLFNQPFATSQGDIGGGTPLQASGVIAPFADRISNVANVGINDQAGENEMFGVSGQYGLLDYPNSSQVPGLYNSTLWGVTAFASQRIAVRQYFGAEVEHSRIVSFLKGTDSGVQSDNIFPFYTIYLRNSEASTLSISVTGGPEHYIASQAPETAIQEWTPAGTIGVGWQGHLSTISGSYSHNVTGGGGLPGAYEEDRAAAAFRRELTHTWEINFSGFYALNKNKTPLFPFSEPGGHTVTATASVQHQLSKSLKFLIGYDRMQESYSGIGALAKLPNSDREYGQISWQWVRPIGR
jgi:hypothetical protein